MQVEVQKRGEIQKKIAFFSTTDKLMVWEEKITYVQQEMKQEKMPFCETVSFSITTEVSEKGW